MSKGVAKHTGFTIVELLIVIVVIGILAAIVIVAYTGIQVRAKDSVLVSRIDQIHKSLDLYYIDNSTYPKLADWGAMGINDDTGVWPIQNMTGLTLDTLKTPYDTTGSITSMSETSISLQTIRYVSFTSTAATCWQASDVCVSYRIWYTKGDNSVVTFAEGSNPPAP